MRLRLTVTWPMGCPPKWKIPPTLRSVATIARTLDLVSLVAGCTSYKVVANLPYYAASPIIRRFLESDRPPTRMIVMVQREVAESMAALPGKMSLLSVGTQFYARARIVCQVPPSAFRPVPKVASAVVRLDVLPRPAVEVADSEQFFHLVQAGFSAPRKQLRNSLSHGLGETAGLADAVLAGAKVDGTRRPGTLALDEWAAIYDAWRDVKQASEIEGAARC